MNLDTAIAKLDTDFAGVLTDMTTMAKANEISSHTFGKFIKALAINTYKTEKTEGAAMAKLFATPMGMAMLKIHAKMPTLAEAAQMRDLGIAKCDYITKGDEGDDDPDPDAMGHHFSPHYAQLVQMAEKHRLTPEGQKMSHQQAFNHVAVNTEEGRTLLGKDKAWHDARSRSLISQGQRIAGMS
jgi:hypothetical protein